MAISLISPGVKITESQIVSSVQATGTTIGATAGQFRWGPMEQPILVISENELVKQFGRPNLSNNIDFMSSAIYLGYSPALYVVRANATSANNATASGTATLVKNDDFYEKNFVTGSETTGPWVAKHPGLMGNSLKVSTCPSATAFQSTLTGSYTTTTGSKTVVGASSTANTQLTVGDAILLSDGTQLRTFFVASTVNTTHITVTTAPNFSTTTTTPTRKWEYANSFDGAPGTSSYAANRYGYYDEMHIAVIDEDGLFTDVAGTILEKFTKVSKGSDARKAGNKNNFYKTIINDSMTGSKYIRWGNKDSQGTNWETTVVNKAFTTVTKPINYSLSGGIDGTVTDAFRISAFNKLANKSTVSASLLFTGSASATVVNSVVANVAEVRKDLVVCFSPALADCQSTDLEVTAIKTFADTVTPSTYAFMDANWQWMYDAYNIDYFWIPSNPATAGRMAATDQQTAPWFSPAGYVNGSLGSKVEKLAFNPNSEERDELYKYGINPIISETGRGFFLFGDKTFTTEAGSFNRINVRRLFITIEKTIGDIASNLLFGINDDATRTSFTNTVEPYLRTVQARRGIIEFKFVCDATNNSDASVNNNEFTADIFIRPVSSINFIQLNFVSVGGAAQFAALG
jgi:hypothetical protein